MGTEKRQRQKANRALKQQEAVRQQSRRKTTRWILIGVGAIAGVFLLAWIASTFVADDDPAPTDSIVSITVPTDTSASTVEPEPTVRTSTESVPGTTGG